MSSVIDIPSWDHVPSLDSTAMQRALADASKPIEEGIDVCTYHAGIEAFSRSDLATVTEPGAEPMRAGTISRTDGPAHTVRRPLVTRVTVRQARLWLEGGKLEEVAARLMAETELQVCSDGKVGFDLVPLAKRLFTELAASLAGLRGYEDQELYEELSRIREDFGAVVALRFAQNADERAAILCRSAQAMQRFEKVFFEPAMEWHLDLLKKHEAGQIEKQELPSNLMMLICTKADDYYLDRGNALRETMGIMNAASDTAAAALVNTFAELETWCKHHPEDHELRTDHDFLFRAVAENLRLHSAFPVFARRAVDDVTLVDGTFIPKGRRVAIKMHRGGRDAAVFGEDAEVFNPHRPLREDVAPYGLGFGAGPHMCAGRTFVLGWHGTDGAVGFMLRWLYERGAAADHSREAQYCKDFDLDKWDYYPVTIEAGKLAGSGAALR